MVITNHDILYWVKYILTRYTKNIPTHILNKNSLVLKYNIVADIKNN